MRVIHPTDRPNFCRIDMFGMKIWFSYETPIAFEWNGHRLIRDNEWGPTTGKHIKYVKCLNDVQVSGTTFLTELEHAIECAVKSTYMEG